MCVPNPALQPDPRRPALVDGLCMAVGLILRLSVSDVQCPIP